MPDGALRPSFRPDQVVAAIRLEPIAVAADRQRVRAFAESIEVDPGLVADGLVPSTFPITWMAHPSVLAAARELAGGGRVPLHAAQSFAYVRPIQLAEQYSLSVTLTKHRAGSGDAIDACGTVADAHGETVCVVRAKLVLLGEGEPTA